ncbi:MAG TPA: 1-acyl-sn-glycerol-3-phosphate acyltransferase, partial [Acidimicrobiia bacterium]|nr:1-acyl-sn-glycerol-3-phosphate acyltransferase [Acidimicrobiia bacterium]
DMVDPDYAARATAGGADRDPEQVVAEIVAGPAIQAGLDRLTTETERPRAELEREAKVALGEMVAVQSQLALDAVDRLARFALRAYDIEADSDALDALRSLNRRHALVFLPSHKSYLDPFILRGALGRAGLPCNHILGGVNVPFWPMGPVLRRSGVVFIRRTIKDDAVYKVALRAYLGYLVEQRYNLEWYLEGGRSRTGKLRPPRLGVLSYLVEAFRERGVDDVFLVPVSIAYDQLQEVAAMAAEEHGAEKKAESFAWMLKYIRSQGQRLGKAYINFAEPVSLRQVRTERKLGTEKIAFEVLHRINRVTPITPPALLTLALLGIGDRALTPAEIRAVLDPLLDYVGVRKLPQAGTVDLAAPDGLLPALDALVTTKVVSRFTGGVEPVYAIGENQHLVAAYSRNRIIHFFVTRAITELVLLHLIRRPVGPDARGVGGVPPTGAAGAANDSDLGARAWAEALRLRDLLKYEFFFAAKPEFAEDLRAELAILDPDWEKKADDPTAIAAGLAELPLLLGHRILGSFLEAYMVVADRLTAHPAGPVDEGPFLEECIGVGRQYRLQQRIHSGESISKELFKNALSLAAGRGLLADPGTDPDAAADIARKREAFAAELREVVDHLDSLRRLAGAALERTTAEEGPE